jgi:hypothetical protein
MTDDFRIEYIPTKHGYMGIIIQDPQAVAERVRAQLRDTTPEERIMAAMRYAQNRLQSASPEPDRFAILEKLPRDLWQDTTTAESILTSLWYSRIVAEGHRAAPGAVLSITPVRWGYIDDDSMTEKHTSPDGPWTFVMVQVTGPIRGAHSEPATRPEPEPGAR